MEKTVWGELDPALGEQIFPRRVPTQRRSRERFERMLSVAESLIAEHGIDGVRMSEIAERAGVSIGSLYQYFPDKAAIVGTLGERYEAEGRTCVQAELAPVRTDAEFVTALHRIVDGYYEMFLARPAMRDIWMATQGDRTLQELDAACCALLADMVFTTLTVIRPKDDRARLRTLSSLIIQLIAAAVRHAISLDRAGGDATVEMFKRASLANVLDALDVERTGP